LYWVLPLHVLCISRSYCNLGYCITVEVYRWRLITQLLKLNLDIQDTCIVSLKCKNLNKKSIVLRETWPWIMLSLKLKKFVMTACPKKHRPWVKRSITSNGLILIRVRIRGRWVQCFCVYFCFCFFFTFSRKCCAKTSQTHIYFVFIYFEPSSFLSLSSPLSQRCRRREI